jgi:energy-converting hydrogenase Eha subunit E
MNIIISRIAAVIAAAIVTFVLGLLGVDVSAEQTQGIVAWLTTGLSALGMFLVLLLYGPFHKLISRYTNPADTAAHPNQSAAQLGLGKDGPLGTPVK